MGLDSVELVLATEAAFDISIPDDLAAALRTPQMLADHVCEALTAQGRSLPANAVLQRIVQLSSEQLGIPIDEIHPDHDFVKDLGMD